STQIDNENDQRSLSSKRNINTQTTVEDVRQLALFEVYQPPVVIQTIVKCSHSYKRSRERKKAYETEQVVNKDPPPSINLTSNMLLINRYLFDSEFCRQRQDAIDNIDYQKNIILWRAASLNEVIFLDKNLSMGKNLIDFAWIIF
ncbi:unnamed protein product, partial [Rotaria sp. Silwood2]